MRPPRLIVLGLAACAPRFDPTERCNGVDDDGDGVADEGFDQDGDGFLSCATELPADCDDRDPEVRPGAPERCDGQDSNCDGSVPPAESDLDLDGFAPCEGDCDDESSELSPIDADLDGHTSCSGDCDDADPGRRPGVAEGCDGIDTDCDGLPDESEDDLDGDGQPRCAGDCDDGRPDRHGLDLDGDGVTSCGLPADCADEDPRVFPGGSELCDGLDNDCDGRTDDDCV